ncbi:aspartate aminotransferase [Angomonas deanei]|uniref:Aspartate aminotransferase n=2 Tax=Angomonas deanei TaxID=59799 RepID=A0A7G2C618_9TRYP|nr:aspartate aminotransferase [Angomonas deanei]CAD2214594.1 Aminotransferase class I and II, putative [Angomonas deanei]|eukprot:EPY34467.1 aspartate aminotransferase [Angomonas deanei]
MGLAHVKQPNCSCKCLSLFPIFKVERRKENVMSHSPFEGVKLLPPDPIFGLAAKAKAASEPKANLVIGAYRDENGRPYVLPVVRQAEELIQRSQFDHEYLPIRGHDGFITASLKLLYGECYSPEHCVGAQTLSGTGAVAMAAHFLRTIVPKNTTVYVSDPTWANHYGILQNAGFPVKAYRYYCSKTIDIDFEGYKQSVLSAPEKSIFVLHSCAHNPTGVDPSKAQWAELADLFAQKKHYVIFDTAYQGYASGNLDTDAYAPRLFATRGIYFLAAQSYSKNLGLYGERVGCISAYVANKAEGAAVVSQFCDLVRKEYSNPPSYGARIAYLVLTEPNLRQAWETQLAEMAKRIQKMRSAVYHELVRLQTPGKWSHVTRQIGMFSYLGLSSEESQYCQEKHVFITGTARANMAGLTEETALLLAKTIDEAVRKFRGSKL